MKGRTSWIGLLIARSIGVRPISLKLPRRSAIFSSSLPLPPAFEHPFHRIPPDAPASFCGRGDETTWLNAFRKWPASVSGNFIGSSGVGGQPRMGTPLQEKRSPRLLCLETYLAGAAFHFNEESVPPPPAGHYRTLKFATVLGGKAGGALTFSPTLCSVPCLQILLQAGSRSTVCAR
jgi:hypothetical protein